MDIRINNCNFKGYDARPLRGFLMSSDRGGIASEMLRIGQKEKFSIFFLDTANRLNPTLKENIMPRKKSPKGYLWSQDLWTIFQGKLFSKNNDKYATILKQFFDLRLDFTQQIARSSDKIEKAGNKLLNILELFHDDNDKGNELLSLGENIEKINRETHIPGGNIYIVQGDNGNEVIVGQKELLKYSIDEIKGMYNTDKVTVLPQCDYHIDLFIRPLDKKRILLADDNLTLETLENGLKFAEKYKNNYPAIKVKNRLQLLISNFKAACKKNSNPKIAEAEKILTDAGYEVIKVPGNFYYIYKNPTGENNIYYVSNYINANVLVNQDGDLVYITNKSCIDEDMGIDYRTEYMDYSFRQSFINALSPHVKPEHIYFVEGDDNFLPRKMLGEYMGGIHCACAEIPFENK